MNEDHNKSKHIMDLSKELLDDIELSRSSGENLLLKATRLARYVGSDEIKEWLTLEMQGYNTTESVSRKYLFKTGRWIDVNKGTGYFGPLAQIEAAIDIQTLKLKTLRIPDGNGDKAVITVNNITQTMGVIGSAVSQLSGVRSRVMGLLHRFATDIYYTKIFDTLTESIFERYKNEVDSLIAVHCGKVLGQIPSVMDRLSENNVESISQALVTCRRIIDSFADSIYPPSEETIEIGGNTLSLKADKHQNRINAFIHMNCNSASQKKKLRQNLSNLYERVSTGVHSEVTHNEAIALFLNTYLLLGEILNLNSK